MSISKESIGTKDFNAKKDAAILLHLFKELILHEVLEFIEKAFAFPIILFACQRIELLEGFLLLAGQIGRYFQINSDILVSAASAVDIRDTLISQAEYSRRLRSFRNIVFYLAIDSWDNHLITQHGLREGDWNFAPNIEAISLKQRVRTNSGCDIDISCRSAIDAMVTLSTQDEGLSIIDTCRNINLEFDGFTDSTHSLTFIAGILDDLTGTGAFATSLHALHNTKWGSLLNAHLTSTMTLRTSFRRTAFCGTGAGALFTLNQTAEADFLLAALCSLHKGKCNIDIDIVSSNWCIGVSGSAGTAEASKAAATAAKEAVENISDISKVESACTEATAACAIVRVNTGMAKLVVARTLFRVGQDRIRFIDLFEFCLCLFISWIQVRVILLCQLSVSLFQLIVGTTLLDTQHLIIISFFLCHSIHLLFLPKEMGLLMYTP